MEEERDYLDKNVLELVGLMLEDWEVVSGDKFWKMEITKRGVPRKPDDQQSKNIRLYMKKMD
jgi:hypothetical protein